MKKLLVMSSIVLALSVQSQVMAKDVSSTTMGQKLDDAAIVAVVNTDFMKDKELSAIKINVDSTKGNVILRGTAPNHDAMERATRIAKSVDGVVSVDNRITLDGDDSMISSHDKHVMRENMNATYNEVKHDAAVTGHNVKVGTNNMLDKAGEKIDDAAINVAINAKLAADDDLSAFKINVDVRDGKVWLKGKAPSIAAKNRATTLAKSVDGVISVRNKLRVRK